MGNWFFHYLSYGDLYIVLKGAFKNKLYILYLLVFYSYSVLVPVGESVWYYCFFTRVVF